MENVFSCMGYIKPNTVISNAFIEHFMLDANGSYVKVYLYLSEYIQAEKRTYRFPSLLIKWTAPKEILFVLYSIGKKKGLSASLLIMKIT